MKSWLLAATLTLAACASAPSADPASQPPAATVDPVGIFDFNTVADGTAVTGALTITRVEGGYGGTITTNVTDPIPVSMVTVNGMRMTVMAMTPDGQLTFDMDFAGDEFRGTWSLGEMSGTHTGRRRTS